MYAFAFARAFEREDEVLAAAWRLAHQPHAVDPPEPAQLHARVAPRQLDNRLTYRVTLDEMVHHDMAELVRARGHWATYRRGALARPPGW